MSNPSPGGLRRWLYQGQRPNPIAKFANWLTTVLTGAGITFGYSMVNLEVTGRKSGKPIVLPVVLARFQDARYLVSMLGEEVNWVRNARAAGGEIALLTGHREEVRLVEVPVDERGPILQAYIQAAPGARAHMAPLTVDSPLADFQRDAARFPTFRVEPRS